MKIKQPKQCIFWGINPRSRLISNKKIYNRQETIKAMIREER